MSRMRPNSQKDRTHSAHKPEFQTKMKSRLGGHLNESVDSGRLGQTQRSGQTRQHCQLQDDLFNKTASKLSDSNFSHHNQ